MNALLSGRLMKKILRRFEPATNQTFHDICGHLYL
jgi:hypothetical protein